MFCGRLKKRLKLSNPVGWHFEKKLLPQQRKKVKARILKHQNHLYYDSLQKNSVQGERRRFTYTEREVLWLVYRVNIIHFDGSWRSLRCRGEMTRRRRLAGVCATLSNPRRPGCRIACQRFWWKVPRSCAAPPVSVGMPWPMPSSTLRLLVLLGSLSLPLQICHYFVRNCVVLWGWGRSVVPSVKCRTLSGCDMDKSFLVMGVGSASSLSSTRHFLRSLLLLRTFWRDRLVLDM